LAKRIPILTDTHAGSRGDSHVLYNIQRLFYEDIFWPAIDAEGGVTDILHLGDLMDRRKYVNYETLQFAKSTFFEPARQRGIKIHWVIGNHDAYFKHTLKINAAEAFNEFENLHVYTEATQRIFDGVDILLMPWLCDENLQQGIDAVANFDGATVAGHFEFGGFEMYRGSPNYHGVSTKPYDHFALVMSGHYHHRSSRKNIHYLGSPYEMTWGDYGDERGFHWWTPKETKLELVPNPHRLFYRYVYDDTNASTTYVRDLLATVNKDSLSQKIIKVIVKNKTKPVWYEAFAEAILRLGAFDVQFIDDTNWSTESLSITDTDTTMDTLKMIEWYVEGQIWSSPDIQDSVKQLLVELYHEASEQAKTVARN
jgi:DNA repair exonuclease SbcCD nuclease subunit